MMYGDGPRRVGPSGMADPAPADAGMGEASTLPGLLRAYE